MEVTKRFTMEHDYDVIGDSLFFYVEEDYEYKRSVRLTDDIILDFDIDDVPVALELLNASKILKVNKFSLKGPVGLDMNICIGEDSIKLDAKLRILIHNKKTLKPLIEETVNSTNLSSTQVHFATA